MEISCEKEPKSLRLDIFLGNSHGDERKYIDALNQSNNRIFIYFRKSKLVKKMNYTQFWSRTELF